MVNKQLYQQVKLEVESLINFSSMTISKFIKTSKWTSNKLKGTLNKQSLANKRYIKRILND